jgi:hypothetical protein
LLQLCSSPERSHDATASRAGPGESGLGTRDSRHSFAVKDERTPKAFEDSGRDVTGRVEKIDRVYPDGFPLEPVRGYAAPHNLTLDLGNVPVSPVLLLTGWTDYAFSSDNIAAAQAGLSLEPPSLQAQTPSGQWRTVVHDIGIPVGRPQTVVVDLNQRLRPGEHVVRISTSMRIYWDRVAIGTALTQPNVRTVHLDPASAMLRERGFSADIQPDGQQPSTYEYAQVSTVSPWKSMPGRYTRQGDVRALLTRADDMFVVAKPGDEIALSFDAAATLPVPAGWTHTFFLLADGYSKEMDIHSASPDAVAPLPFHRMSEYPYKAPEQYPDTAAYRTYLETYNTRAVVRPEPLMETLMADRSGQPR